MHTDQLWLVSYAEDDDRELTTEELARALGRHEVDFGTLVWREGLASWHPLSAFEEFSGIGTSSPGFIWPSTKSDAPPPDEEPVTVKTTRPPLPDRKASRGGDKKSIQHKARTINGNGRNGEQRSKPPGRNGISASEEELDANDLLWLPADSEPISSDFLGLSRPDASLIPPPINLPAQDPLDARDSKASALEAAMAFRVRVAPMPDASTTRPVSKDSVPPVERKPIVCVPWIIAASLVTAAGYFLFTQQKPLPPQAASYSSPAPVEQIATPNATIPTPAVAPTPAPKDIPEPSPEPSPELAPPTAALVGSVPTPSEAKPEEKAAAVTSAEAPQPAIEAPVAKAKDRPVEAPRKRAEIDTLVTPEKPRSSTNTVAAQKETIATEPFDKVAAMAALDEAARNASSCRKEGDPSGTAEVRITFSPSGRATQAVISGPPFAGTTTGSCIATAMRAARMPAFAGERTTVQKRIVVN